MMGYFGHMMGGYGGYGGGFFGVGIVFMLIFWILLILGIAAFLKWAAGHKKLGGCCGHDKEKSADSALEVLRQRYARGEIDKNKFEEMKKDLEK